MLSFFLAHLVRNYYRLIIISFQNRRKFYKNSNITYTGDMQSFKAKCLRRWWQSNANTAPQSTEMTIEAGCNSTDSKALVAYFTHLGNNVFDGDISDVDVIASAIVQCNGDEFPPQIVDGVHKGNAQIIAEDIADLTCSDLLQFRQLMKQNIRLMLTTYWMLHSINTLKTLDMSWQPM